MTMDKIFISTLACSLLLHGLILSIRYLPAVPPEKSLINLEVTLGNALSLSPNVVPEKKVSTPPQVPAPVKPNKVQTPTPASSNTVTTKQISAIKEEVSNIKNSPKPVAVGTSSPVLPVVRKQVAEPKKPKSLKWLPAQKQEFEPAAGGYVLGNVQKQAQSTGLNYEMKLSLWLDKFRKYPPEAQAKQLKGEGVVFITIDRVGHVMLARIKQSTGHPILDDALMQMVKDANPVLPVPKGYFPEQSSFSYEVAFRFYPTMWE